MKKLIATAALALLLVLVGCAQGTSSSSARASSASISSAATSSQSSDGPGASDGQSRAASAETPVASSVASAENGVSPQSGAVSAKNADSFVIGIGDTQLEATLSNTDTARSLTERLQAGPVTVSLHAYGGFEKIGPLPWSLPASDDQITAHPGDIMLYQGSQITIFTGSNSWSYTPLGHIEDIPSDSLLKALGEGDVEATLSLV